MAGAGEGVVAGTQPGASSWLGRMPGWHTGPGMTAAAMSRRVEPPDAPRQQGPVLAPLKRVPFFVKYSGHL